MLKYSRCDTKWYSRHIKRLKETMQTPRTMAACINSACSHDSETRSYFGNSDKEGLCCLKFNRSNFLQWWRGCMDQCFWLSFGKGVRFEKGGGGGVLSFCWSLLFEMPLRNFFKPTALLREPPSGRKIGGRGPGGLRAPRPAAGRHCHLLKASRYWWPRPPVAPRPPATLNGAAGDPGGDRRLVGAPASLQRDAECARRCVRSVEAWQVLALRLVPNETQFWAARFSFRSPAAAQPTAL